MQWINHQCDKVGYSWMLRGSCVSISLRFWCWWKASLPLEFRSTSKVTARTNLPPTIMQFQTLSTHVRFNINHKIVWQNHASWETNWSYFTTPYKTRSCMQQTFMRSFCTVLRSKSTETDTLLFFKNKARDPLFCCQWITISFSGSYKRAILKHAFTLLV